MERSTIVYAASRSDSSRRTSSVSRTLSLTDALALLRRYENAFVELTLHLNAPLTAQETLSLREANEGLVSLIVRTQTAVDAPEIVRSALSSEELFVEYYKSVYGEPPSDELKEAFLELLGEGA